MRVKFLAQKHNTVVQIKIVVPEPSALTMGSTRLIFHTITVQFIARSLANFQYEIQKQTQRGGADDRSRILKFCLN